MADEQVAEIPRDEVMARRFELDSQIAIIGGRHKAELAPLLEEQKLCEQFIKESMITGNEQQVKMAGTGHQCFFTTKDSVTVEDMSKVIGFALKAAPAPEVMEQSAWDAIIAHIQATGMWGILNNACNKTAVKELLENTSPETIGVKYTSFKDLSWRRGKG